MDTLAPDIFGHFLLQYKGFPLSEVKNVLVTPVGTKLFITCYGGLFYCVLNSEGLFIEVPVYINYFMTRNYLLCNSLVHMSSQTLPFHARSAVSLLTSACILWLHPAGPRPPYHC